MKVSDCLVISALNFSPVWTDASLSTANLIDLLWFKKNGLCLIIYMFMFPLNISGNLHYKTTLTDTCRLKTSNIGGSQLIETTNSRARYYVLHQVAGSLSPGEARVPSELWGTADIGIHRGKGSGTGGTTTTQIGRNVVQLRKRSRLLTTQTQVGQKSKRPNSSCWNVTKKLYTAKLLIIDIQATKN